MTMDEHTWELLSRYVDGDLPPAEARALEERFDTEPELARELAALEQLRGVVRQVAAADSPPAVLDELLEPLRRSRPAQLRVRPALAWLAAAATLFLGVTVGVEVFHRRSTPLVQQTRHRVARQPTPYQLHPLPDGRGEEKPEGALQRLLASPVPVPTVGPLAPVPPEGPLDVAPRADEEAGPVARAQGEERVWQRATAAGGVHGKVASSASAGSAPRRETMSGPAETAAAPPGESRKAAPKGKQAELRLGAGVRPLVVHLPADSDLGVGRYPVWITVDDSGNIVAAEPRPPKDEEWPPGLAASCQRLVGAHLAGLAPGRHAATLVVD